MLSPTSNKIRNYWDARPCNIRHSKASLGSKKYFKEVVDRRYFVEPHIPPFCQFKKWYGKKVLEIGCGIGTDTIRFATAGAEVTAVDISSKSLSICESGLKDNGVQAKLYLGDAEHLSSWLPEEKYDLIYSFGVLHHTTNPEKVLDEIKKYCHKNTEIRIMLYSKWSWKSFWIVMKYGRGQFWKAKELIQKYSEAQVGCPVTHCYSMKDVEGLIGSRFKKWKAWKDHIFVYKIDKYIRYEYEKCWYFKVMPKVIFNWMRKKLGWHILIVAKGVKS